MGRPKGESSTRYTVRLFTVAFASVLIIGMAAPALSVGWTPKILSEFTAGSPTSWSASITASITGTSDDAFFGVRPDATGGFDPAYDSPEPPPPPTSRYISAYTYYSPNPSGYKSLDVSYIAPDNSLVWESLRIKYVNEDDPDTPIDITLTWNISDIPTNYSVCLYEGATLRADMRAVSSYVFNTAPTTKTFKIVVSRPALISPANGSIVSPTPTFTWASVSDPSGVTYQIQIDDDEDFSSPVYDDATLTDTTFTLPGESALAAGTYFWHIQARNGTGQDRGLSDTWNFTALPIGTIGVLLMPLLLLLPLVLMLRRQNRRYRC